MLSIEEEGERREVERGERQAVLQTYQGGALWTESELWGVN